MSDTAALRPSALLPCLALLVNAFFWGLAWWPFRRLDALGLHSLWATAFIYGLGTVLVTLWRPRAWRALVAHPVLAWIMLASGLNNVAFNWAVQEGEVVRVILLFYMMPVWATVMARWLLREPVTGVSLLQIALAVGGAVLVLWRPGLGLPVPRNLPEWLGLFGGFCFACVNVLLRRHADTPNEARSLAMFAGACAVAVVAGLALGPSGRVPLPPAPQLGWVLGLSLLAVTLMFGNLALQYGAARLPAQTTALVMLSEVIFASVSSVLIAGEVLSPYAVMGGVLILASALLSALAPAWRERRASLGTGPS